MKKNKDFFVVLGLKGIGRSEIFFLTHRAECFVDIYLLYGKNYRSVILAVKRKLSDSHWSKSARAVLCRECRLAHQLVRAELKDKVLKWIRGRTFCRG